MVRIWIVDILNDSVIEGIRSDSNVKQNYLDSLGLIKTTKEEAKSKLKKIKVTLKENADVFIVEQGGRCKWDMAMLKK